MSTHGRRKADERDFGRRDHDGRVRNYSEGLRVEKVTRWHLTWHGPPNLIPRLRQVVVGFRYYDSANRGVVMPWEKQHAN